jgi:hypothetical protein
MTPACPLSDAERYLIIIPRAEMKISVPVTATHLMRRMYRITNPPMTPVMTEQNEYREVILVAEITDSSKETDRTV